MKTFEFTYLAEEEKKEHSWSNWSKDEEWKSNSPEKNEDEKKIDLSGKKRTITPENIYVVKEISKNKSFKYNESKNKYILNVSYSKQLKKFNKFITLNLNELINLNNILNKIINKNNI